MASLVSFFPSDLLCRISLTARFQLRTRHLSPRTFALLRSSPRPSSNFLPSPTTASAVSRAGFRHAARRWQQPSVFQTQLEDPATASAFESLRATAAAPKQTLTEKIVQKFAVGLPAGQYVKSGDYVSVQPQHCMSHDNTWPIAKKFMSMGATSIKDNKQIVMTLDHDVQNKSEANLKKYSLIEEFAAKHGVNFYPAGRGIGHQIMCESGYVQPGTMVVASDSHSNMYGGLGALGTAVVRTDAASIWSTGRTWYQVPPVAKVNFTGVLPEGVTGKDVIVALCGLFNRDEVLNHAIEFAGSEETLQSLQIDDRLAIANMTTEFGALAGVFPVDSVLLGWLRFKATEAAMWGTEAGRTGDDTRFTHESVEELANNPLLADPGAKYAKELYLNLSTLSPYVAGPNSVKVATPVAELEPQQIKVNKAYLVSCTNSRASDIAAAAKVFKDAAEKNDGKIPKISDGVEFYIAAASAREQKTAEEQGDWQALLDAGARELPSGCGPCIGLGTGLLQPDEVGISASNRNFKARMGSADAKAYLASPEVVAASALSGVISGPGRYQQPEDWKGVEYGEGDGIKEGERMVTAEEALDRLIGQIDGLLEKAEAETSAQEVGSEEDDSALVSILPGFPEKIEGEIVFVDNDAINTDGIYPGRLTYNDDVSKEQMAEACMSNYDPAFQTIAKSGDILVSGFSFGVGSSREQAATSILAKGIPLVVAGSFSNIFSRNSINNGLPSLEVPKLVERLREAFPSSESQQGQAQQEVKEPSLNKESLDSPPPAPPKQLNSKVLTRRTGWHLTWDVQRSKVVIDEGNGKRPWSAKVGTLPENVQEIIAKGGLENWVKAQIGA